MILIIEDDMVLQMLNRLVLSREGYQVHLAATLADSRTALQEQNIEVVLLDLHLPDGSGLDILTEYSTYPSNDKQHPLFIVMTGDVTLNSAIKALRLGAFDYVTKPMNAALLLAAVRRALECRQLRQAARELPFHDLAAAQLGDSSEGIATRPHLL